MSIFKNILSKIFPSSHPANKPAAEPTAPAAGASAPGAAPQAAEPVDVAAILTQKAANHPEKLNWQTSIVDLMKLLKLDSSLASRQELAKELGYTGSMSDSATMNVWLHKQVMTKLAANGGKVPDELK